MWLSRNTILLMLKCESRNYTFPIFRTITIKITLTTICVYLFQYVTVSIQPLELFLSEKIYRHQWVIHRGLHTDREVTRDPFSWISNLLNEGWTYITISSSKCWSRPRPRCNYSLVLLKKGSWNSRIFPHIVRLSVC